MTTAADGSVAEKPAGTPDGQHAAADNGSAAAAESPFAGLQDAGTRTWVEKKGYKSVEDLAKAGMHSESLLGASVKVPAADAPADEWTKFYSKVGRPEKADGYELKRPDGLPADLPYDEALAGSFKAWAHSAGLNGRQAQALHDAFATAQAEKAKEHVTALTKAVETTADALVKEWGPQDSEGFKTKHEMANRAIKKLGLVESFKKSGIILQDNALTDPALAMAFRPSARRCSLKTSSKATPAKAGITRSRTAASTSPRLQPSRKATLTRRDVLRVKPGKTRNSGSAGADPEHAVAPFLRDYQNG